MIKKLQKKYALSEQGAKDLIKGCLACNVIKLRKTEIKDKF